jgi:succinyl-CoA synthetase alpha subunit
MAIFINENTKVLVQGMTGSEGTKHTARMIKSGTKIVGGVTPGKGGQSVEIEGVTLPVFNSVSEAVAATGANASVVFVPPKFAKAAVIDAIDAKLPLVVVITE